MLKIKLLRAWFVFLILIVLLLGFGFIQTKKTIQKALDNQIVLLNKTQPLHLTYDKLELSYLQRSFELTNVVLLQDSSYLDLNKLTPHTLINSIKVKNFKVLPLLINKKLDVDEFEVIGLEVVFKKGGLLEKRLTQKTKKKASSSSRNVLNQLSISKFKVSDFQIVHFDEKANDTINALKGDLLVVKDILFTGGPDKKVISIKTDDVVFELDQMSVTYGSIKDKISLSKGIMNLGTGYSKFRNLKLSDLNSLKKKVSNNTFTKSPGSFDISMVEVFGLDTSKLFKNFDLMADSVLIDNAKITILKDSNKPWNKSVTKPMPQQVLRNSNKEFWINKVLIKNSSLNYLEIINDKEVVINLEDVQSTILNLGTVKSKYNDLESPNIDVTISAKVFKELNFLLNLKLINPLHSNFFSFNGHTSSFNFESFNPVMVPSSSIKFESGRVLKIDFNGQGNETSTKGDFVMRYDNLKTIILRKDAMLTNKTFSWLANSAVRKENPKNGRLKTAQIDFNRIPYKGFGNYMVKSIESGLINSVYPFGKRTRKK
ncbi:hypothetical protein [Croceitalea rosinachiae]|uniref:AsmA-like protein n=1 Tax=Croceitalea rosinachiae TaxID=3075596 RepID=A0ABU3A7W8_9FLAO|nr:hypothetical protein [Croceitalea sp. F388]MDT0605970.1 hypothetical protein [Croceitalea sp. F388]